MSAGTSQSATRLVGRLHELEAIEAALDRSRTRGACLAFSGSLGLGKSRLLRELETRADARGDLVLSGMGSEWEAAVPYGVASGTLADYLAALPAPELDRLTAGLVPELLPALPSLASADAQPAPAVEAERYRTHRALRTLLMRLAERKPGRDLPAGAARRAGGGRARARAPRRARGAVRARAAHRRRVGGARGTGPA